MSNYCYAYCKTCKEASETDLNRGDNIIQDIGYILPILKYAYEKYHGSYLEMHTMTHGDELVNFMINHSSHDLWCMSEYGEDDERSSSVKQGKFEIKELPDVPL